VGDWERRGLGEKKMNVQHPTSNIERRIGKIKNTGEGEVWNWECGLRPLRAVGSIYEPEAVGAIGAYAPEGMREKR